MLRVILLALGTFILPLSFASAAFYLPSPSLLEIIVGLMAIGSLIGGCFLTYVEYQRYSYKQRNR